MRKKDIMAGVAEGPDAVERLLAKAEALYDNDVGYLDRSLDRLLRKLAEDASAIETHIVVVSDHGESLGEGDSVGHGSRLNEAELRVPAFVISPRVVAGVRDDVRSAIDIAPTLLSLAGLELTDRDLPGRDLTATPTNDSQAFAMRRTFRETDKSELRLDGQRYPLDGILFCQVDSEGRILRGNADALLIGDEKLPAEKRDEIIDAFRTFQDRYERMNESTEIDAETRRGLKALGYIN